MKRGWELLLGVADLVVAEDPQALAERVLESSAVLLRTRCAALFQREQDRMRLFASRSVQHDVLDLVARAWASHAAQLQAGEVVAVMAPGPAGLAEEARRVLAGVEAFAIAPVRSKDRLHGLLYLDGPRALAGAQAGMAVQLATVAAVALRAPMADRGAAASGMAASLGSYLERTTPAEVGRDQLLILLERHEWNLARVARALGVTRRTMYLRLDRYGIERRHVPKASRKREAT